MENKDFLVTALCVLVVCLLLCYMNKSEGFSLDKKPFEAEWTLLHRNPFDDVDYQTPEFHRVY